MKHEIVERIPMRKSNSPLLFYFVIGFSSLTTTGMNASECRGVIGPGGNGRCVGSCPDELPCGEVDLGDGWSSCGCDGIVTTCCHLLYNNSSHTYGAVGHCSYLGCPGPGNLCVPANFPGWIEAACVTPPF